VSETIAAALYLLSENRKGEAVVGKLNPSELEQVIDVIRHQPDRFPPGTLAALKESRPTPPEVSSDPPGAGSHFRGRAGVGTADGRSRACAASRCGLAIITADFGDIHLVALKVALNLLVALHAFSRYRHKQTPPRVARCSRLPAQTHRRTR
jgi:hypothetical protein